MQVRQGRCMTLSDVIVPIEILTYSHEEGTVNGHTVTRGNYATIHEACIALTVPYAQKIGGPILTHAVDTIGTPAEYWIHVHPDGQATPATVSPTDALSFAPPSPGEAPDGADPADTAQAADAGAGVLRSDHALRRTRTARRPAAADALPEPADTAADSTRRHTAAPIAAPADPASVPPTVAVAPVITPVPRPAPDIVASAELPAPVAATRAAPVTRAVPAMRAAPAVLAVPPTVAPGVPGVPLARTPPVKKPGPGIPAPPPTLGDLLGTRPAPPAGPAQLGWRATARRLSGGLIRPRPSKAETARRQAVAKVQRSLVGPRTIVVINPKGGANKTTATLLIAATFGIHRGGYTLAWDNNETRGTMGWRAGQGPHTNTAVDLLRELDRFDDARSARVGDLDNFIRSQGNAQFDVLASDEDAASAASIDAEAFNALHHSLSRFYRIIVVDTGNNMRASNWDAAVRTADQIVIVSTIREDTAQSAAWVADALNEKGHRDKVAAAVTVLASPSPRPDPALAARLLDHFGRLTRAVAQVPFDPALVSGGPIDIEGLSTSSREAWLHATALVADGL